MRREKYRTNTTPRHMLGHVLQPEELLKRIEYRYVQPARELRPWVERYWSVEWRFASGEEFQASTLDDPSTHLTIEQGGVTRHGGTTPGAWFTGPTSAGRFDVQLSKSGSVVGIRFRPGGCHAFWDRHMLVEADTTQPAEEYFSESRLLIGVSGNAIAAASTLDDWLLSQEPTDTDELKHLRLMLTTLEKHPSEPLDEIAERAGCSIRTMQRHFRKLIGVSPKRILMRARVFRAIAELDDGWERTMPELAYSLGWFDQAHFIRDFRAV